MQKQSKTEVMEMEETAKNKLLLSLGMPPHFVDKVKLVKAISVVQIELHEPITIAQKQWTTVYPNSREYSGIYLVKLK